MTAKDQAELRITLLQTLRARREHGATEEALMHELQPYGYDVLLPQLQVELRALGNQNWITPMATGIGAKRWRITAQGESQLTEAGL